MNANMIKAAKASAYLGYLKGHEDGRSAGKPAPVSQGEFEKWLTVSLPQLGEEATETTRLGTFVSGLVILAVAVPIVWKLWTWAFA